MKKLNYWVNQALSQKKRERKIEKNGIFTPSVQKQRKKGLIMLPKENEKSNEGGSFLGGSREGGASLVGVFKNIQNQILKQKIYYLIQNFGYLNRNI